MGISLLGWAVLWVLRASPADRCGVVVPTLAVFQAVVGLLLFRRRPITEPISASAWVVSVPSLLLSGIALKLAPPPSTWPAWIDCCFVAGAIFALISLLSLGRSFAVMPANRSTVNRGPYRFVRHPAYLGEFVMILACCLASPGLKTMWLPLAAAPLLAARILAEEKLLSGSETYQEYRKTTRWRLIPGVW